MMGSLMIVAPIFFGQKAATQIESELVIAKASPTAAFPATPTPIPECQGYTLSIAAYFLGAGPSNNWNLSADGAKIRSCLGALRSPGYDFDYYNGSNATVDSYLSGDSYTYSYCNDNYCGDTYDDMAAWLLMGYFGVTSGLWQPGYNAWVDVPGGKCLRYASTPGGYLTYCSLAVAYYDASCRLIPPNNLPSRMCNAGSFAWSVSPVSLNFKSAKSVTEGMTFVQFPLDPRASRDTWYTWKASEDHPLLVLDPNHTGNVTSPYQLFGSWTFGGRSLLHATALQPSQALPLHAQPWEHGYDALGTLDSNHDGKISGDELKPLGLWFDRNRNGVSEPGEVKSVESSGIRALFYQGAAYDDSVDGFLLKNAFEREVGNTRITGSAVDWFSPGDRLKDNIVRFESFRAARKQRRASPSVETADFLPSGKVNHTSPFLGEWEWSSDQPKDSPSQSIGGILRLLPYQHGEVMGVSISENFYIQPYPVNSEIVLQTLRGQVTNSNSFEFSISSDEWELRSKATLGQDKETLHGETSASSKVENRSFTYSWTAKRTALRMAQQSRTDVVR
jgi:hypothetical protein